MERVNPMNNKAPEEQFEETWKKWMQSPPRKSPSEAAARVGVMIRERRRSHMQWKILAAAAVLLIAISIVFRWFSPSSPPVSPQPAVAVQEAPQLKDGEVLIWLDKDTPLFMTFQSPEEDRGKGKKL